MGIEQTGFSKTLGAVGSAVSNLGPVGAIAGAALQTIGAFSGGGGSVDETTGDYRKSSGLTRVFGWGHSDESLKAKAGRIKASNVAREQTQDIQADYYNNPNIEVQPSVLAAEGGIMRKPVDALVSKGELIYDPETKKLSKVPGSKGKPNKADDVAVKLYEGDVVVSNSPTMLMANGKTPAQNLENMVTIDKKKSNKLSEGTVKAREAIIKKVVNWQEANKTKPQEYAKYAFGIDEVEVDEPIVNKDEKKNINTIAVNPNYNKNISHSRDLAISSWYGAGDPIKYNENATLVTNWLRNNTTALANAKAALSHLPQVKKNLDKGMDFIDAIAKNLSDGLYGQVHDYFSPQWDEITKTPTIAKAADTGWKLNFGDTPTAPKWKGLQIPDTVDPEKQKTPINWGKIGDGLYKAASVLTPLLDREKAEKVDYQVPVAKYISTAVNVDPQLRSINDSYAMARYNQANINPSTGAGMAYGLQAAANRAKQMSDVYNWQTNAQNQLIGRNVDTYNRWSENYANIMNNVYDKAAANRAAARNINRQNKATALKNWGSILRNDKQYAMGRVRMEALDPMMKYGYQNDAKLREMLNEYLG